MKRYLAALLLTACSTPPVQAVSPTQHAHPSSDPAPVAAPSLGPAVTITARPTHTSRSTTRHHRVNWDAIAQCESGGHWNHHVAAHGLYWGGLQMTLGFWHSWHGDRVAPRPDLATKAQQIAVAQRAYLRLGLRPWPTCGARG